MFKTHKDTKIALERLADKLGYRISFFKYTNPFVELNNIDTSPVSLKKFLELRDTLQTLMDYLGVEVKTDNVIVKKKQK